MVRVGAILPLNRYSVILTVAVILAAVIFLERHMVNSSAVVGHSSDVQVIQSAPAPALAAPDSSQSAVTTRGSSSNSSSTSVTVNGQTIPVPDNGSFSQTTQ